MILSQKRITALILCFSFLLGFFAFSSFGFQKKSLTENMKKEQQSPEELSDKDTSEEDREAESEDEKFADSNFAKPFSFNLLGDLAYFQNNKTLPRFFPEVPTSPPNS